MRPWRDVPIVNEPEKEKFYSVSRGTTQQKVRFEDLTEEECRAVMTGKLHEIK